MQTIYHLRTSKNLALIIVLTSILITPFLSFEPILWIKEVALVSITLATGAICALNIRKFRKADRVIKYLSWIMVTALLLNSFLSEVDTTTWLWGYFGRANGSLTYISFLLLLLLNFSVEDEIHSKRMLKAIWIACICNVVYVALQFVRRDPISWNSMEPFGFLGNINFSSALMGVFCILLVWQDTSTKRIQFFLARLTLICLVLYFIWLSGSLQGLLMFAVGFQLRVLGNFIERPFLKERTFLKFLLIVPQLLAPYVIIFLLSTPSFFNGKFLQETLVFRKDYWLAAYNMFRARPLFGVGIDNYGNYYREYRSPTASLDFDRVSNSAHSIFMDLLAGGGLTLFLPYLLIVLYVSFCALKVFLRNESKIDNALVSVWFSLQIQNLIGIQTITLGVINWSVAGLLLARSNFQGVSGNRVKDKVVLPSKVRHNYIYENSVASRKRPESTTEGLLSPKSFLISGSFFLLGLLIATPPLISDVAFNKHFEKNDLNAMTELAAGRFGNQVLLSVALEKATLNDKGEEALNIARLLTSKFPRSYYGWEVLSKLKVTPDTLREHAIREIARIEPNQNNQP